MHLITPSGLSTAGDFSGPCPWAESRPPGLAEILNHWASLLENGKWAVASDAAAENHDWFDSHLCEARLHGYDQLEWYLNCLLSDTVVTKPPLAGSSRFISFQLGAS